MLKIFSGMILGSIVTMLILGGASAANQVQANVQALYADQFNRPDTTTTLLLLVLLGIFIIALRMWPSKPVIQNALVIKKLRQHCK